MQELPRLYDKQEGEPVRLSFYSAFLLNQLNSDPQRKDRPDLQIYRQLKCFQKVKKFYKENPQFIGNRHDLSAELIKAYHPRGHITALFYVNALNKVTWVGQMLKKHRYLDFYYRVAKDFSEMTDQEYYTLQHTKPIFRNMYRRARMADAAHRMCPQYRSKQQQKLWLDTLQVGADNTVKVDDYFFIYPKKTFIPPKYPPKKSVVISSFKIKIENLSLVNLKHSFVNAWQFSVDDSRLKQLCQQVTYSQVQEPSNYLKKKYGLISKKLTPIIQEKHQEEEEEEEEEDDQFNVCDLSVNNFRMRLDDESNFFANEDLPQQSEEEEV